MITKEQIVQTVHSLNQTELEQLGQYLEFIRYQTRIRTIPSFDESQLAALYAESAEEDRELAEEGVSDYALALAQEDAG